MEEEMHRLKKEKETLGKMQEIEQMKQEVQIEREKL